jgi:hypothetical protein
VWGGGGRVGEVGAGAERERETDVGGERASILVAERVKQCNCRCLPLKLSVTTLPPLTPEEHRAIASRSFEGTWRAGALPPRTTAGQGTPPTLVPG